MIIIIDEIESQLRKGTNIEDILEKCDWKKFESVISEIFQENGFNTKQNFRFKTKRRYEIDILAIKNNQIFCIDCKWWGRGRYKKSGLKKAVILQEKRTKEFTKFLNKNIIARNLLKVTPGHAIYSLLATLHEEDMIKENKTLIIPVWKVNRFLTDFDNMV
ncbi:MAG: restriction endonuclease [Candidatus Aenigmarchaeota archaeon]|nr:restriction endonuclease [Candidatus Aenigmarchaeota archaeon]